MQNHSVLPDQFVELDLSIIVVSYNTCEMTLECLRSIREQTKDTHFEIIVVDNNSKDNSVEAISREFPNIKLISLEENLGFAGANNLAAKKARGRRILLLNPDTLVLDRAIDNLFAFADQNPSCRVWGGRTLRGDGSLDPASCWRRMSLWSLACFALGLTYLAPKSAILTPESYGSWKRDSVRAVDIVTGCFLLIDREAWDQLGGFDPAFFMYGEEADLCHRARQAGARPTITPSATIIHYGGASDTVPLERGIKLFKGRTTLLYHHFSHADRRLGRALFLMAPIIRWWIFRVVAVMTRRSALDLNARYWHAIWKRRCEWIGGYASANVSRAAQPGMGRGVP